MSLAVRIIPCLDVRGGRVVKGINFKDIVDAGDPAEAAKRYDAEGADEICMLDIDASFEERSFSCNSFGRSKRYQRFNKSFKNSQCYRGYLWCFAL